MTIIKVTQKHINAGGNSGNNCPINLAICEQLGLNNNKVYVGYIQITIMPQNKIIPISGVVRRKIKYHDKGWNIKPFEFELDY